MKTKRTFLSILTLCIALLFTACSGKGTAGTEKSQNTKTESGSESADDSNSRGKVLIGSACPLSSNSAVHCAFLPYRSCFLQLL